MEGLGATPLGERVHIGFFGVRNAGKSSLVNAVTGQDLAVVSGTPGTTTDPVRKAMELLPAGPVVVIDTPGVDDGGALGSERVRRARQALGACDVAVLVVDATSQMSDADRGLLAEFEKRGLPYVVAWNKADLLGRGGQAAGSQVGGGQAQEGSQVGCGQAQVGGGQAQAGCGNSHGPLVSREVLVSAQTGEGVNALKELVGSLAAPLRPCKRLVGDLLAEGDVVVLVVPIDGSAPKGRIILPQQMVLRDVLDAHATALACQPEELAGTLASLREPPRLVITDSQVFAEVAAVVADDVPLTSFSILMARYKGSIDAFARGAEALACLADDSRVLVSEGCTHHRQCDDIGTVKIPRWIEGFTGCRPRFEFTSGNDFPDDLGGYDLVVHCGGCMLGEREMAQRMEAARRAGVPIVNYGMAIACMNGILERSLQPLIAEPSREGSGD